MADRPASFLQLIRRDRRGRLKVYLGYAAGVGKTWQMLQEAHRLRAESIDVAIGAVETHGRVETDALCEGLERIPPRRGEFRGLPVEEMDLEAVLARRPQVVLVDELAHAIGCSVASVKQARMKAGDGHRSPPPGWEAGVARLARQRAAHFQKLADRLD